MTGPDSGVQRDSHTYPDTTPAGIRSVSQHVRSANSGTALRRSACPLTAIACWPYTHSPVAGYGQFFMTANRLLQKDEARRRSAGKFAPSAIHDSD